MSHCLSSQPQQTGADSASQQSQIMVLLGGTQIKADVPVTTLMTQTVGWGSQCRGGWIVQGQHKAPPCYRSEDKSVRPLLQHMHRLYSMCLSNGTEQKWRKCDGLGSGEHRAAVLRRISRVMGDPE